MPKPVKLHGKGKANNVQRGNKIESNSLDNRDPEETSREFQLQLCWCIQQLERSLNEKKGNEKQLQETWKVLTVLKNNNQSVIRKRQLMRTHFGDYRAKMAAEEKKLAKMTSKIKISESPTKPKATFLRKSIFLSTGDGTVRLNFNVPAEKADCGNISANSDNSVNIATDNVKDNKRSNSVSSVEKFVENKKETAGESESKKFNPTFSTDGFKFNFNVGDS